MEELCSRQGESLEEDSGTITELEALLHSIVVPLVSLLVCVLNNNGICIICMLCSTLLLRFFQFIPTNCTERQRF